MNTSPQRSQSRWAAAFYLNRIRFEAFGTLFVNRYRCERPPERDGGTDIGIGNGHAGAFPETGCRWFMNGFSGKRRGRSLCFDL